MRVFIRILLIVILSIGSNILESYFYSEYQSSGLFPEVDGDIRIKIQNLSPITESHTCAMVCRTWGYFEISSYSATFTTLEKSVF